MEIVRDNSVLIINEDGISLHDGLIEYHFPLPLFQLKHAIYSVFTFGSQKRFVYRDHSLSFRKFNNKISVMFASASDRKFFNIYNNEIVGLSFLLREIHNDEEMTEICGTIKVKRKENKVVFKDVRSGMEDSISYAAPALLFGTCLMRLIGISEYKDGVFECVAVRSNTLLFPVGHSNCCFYPFFMEDVINLMCIL